MGSPELATAVVGSGPAGLLFVVMARLLHARAGGDPEAWPIRLYDKRDAYARTHRLRMDPAPYLAMQREVKDPRFDALVAFLEDDHFSPEVNALETRLSELAADLGVVRSKREIGDGPGMTSLATLRRTFEEEALLGPGTTFTVVAADSVHSVIREKVRGEAKPIRHTHERVARVRVVGDGLLSRLGVVDQYRLSKVLGSVVDYRLNRNGFAEVDLFLTSAEHDAVRGLGATPAAPVPISASMLAKLRAPLFRAIVANLERGGRQVLLQSTFQLEHTLMPKLVFEVPEIGGHVLLVGDAGVSLPFFRGMACLAACAHELARTHLRLLDEGSAAPPGRRAEILRGYDVAADAIKAKEIRVVRSRARLVRILREVVRVSSLLPFPIQSWFLTAPGDDRPRDEPTIGLVANVGLAALAASLAVTSLVTSTAWWSLIALSVELLGGAAYRATLSFEPGPHRWVRRVWEVQIALALAVGGAWTARTSWMEGRLANPLGALYWFALGIAFVIGLVAYERWLAGWLARAELDGR
ncbi:MAG: hypothetical protein JST00_38560 [Deltaproteobacteria bacterium]|nr:hypothetical protein [Deltaproteobacteria bacterium]